MAKNHLLTLKCLIQPQPVNIFQVLPSDFLNANDVNVGTEKAKKKQIHPNPPLFKEGIK